MRNKIKSYLVFTSLLYRIVVYLAMPMLLAGLSLWFGSSLGDAAMMLAAALFPAVEVISDNWLFGGIQTKDTEKLDYLKTSGRGMRMMKNALSLDLVRKFLSAAFTMGICFLAMLANGTGSSLPLQIFLYSITVSWFFSVLGTFLARYGSMLWFSMLTAYGMMISESICWGLFLAKAQKFGWICAALFAVLGILTSILAVKIAMKKVEGSYYDR